jgi:ribosomal protein S18 acetylase RimI-like enzyme
VEIDVQRYARTNAEHSADRRRVGPFLIRFHPRSPLRFLNYAIPDDGAVPSAANVAALVAAFRERDRLPRLEYLPSRAPLVERALAAAGFTVENRAPFMACAAGDVLAPPPLDGVKLTEPADDGELLAGLTVQNAAFGNEPPTPGDVAGLRYAIEGGGVAVNATTSDGRVVGAGQCTVPIAGITEVVGVAVDPAYRRRGIGGAITAHLTATAYERGARTVFLEPAGPAEERIYARAGFRRVGEKLNISLT